MIRATMIAAVLAAAAANCMASTSGSILFRNCDQAVQIMNGAEPKSFNDIYQTGLCLGMVEGVVGTLVMQGDSSPKRREVCPPSGGIRNDDATKAVMSYLFSHPEKANESSVELVSQAIKKAYPCK